MNERTDIDRLLASYFDQPAPELPDRVFDAVRRDIQGTRQRLVLGPWRAPDWRALTRFLQVATTALLLVGLLIITVPALIPGGRAAPTPRSFQSSLYGYSIVVPAGWAAIPATIRWDGVSQPSQGADVDQFAGPHLLVLGYAGPFAGNLAAFAQDRMAANARDHADTCPPNAQQLALPTTIGGEPSVMLGLNCGARIDQAITVHDGVGYAFTIRDSAFSPTLDATDLGSVLAMLESVTFPVAPTHRP